MDEIALHTCLSFYDHKAQVNVTSCSTGSQYWMDFRSKVNRSSWNRSPSHIPLPPGCQYKSTHIFFLSYIIAFHLMFVINIPACNSMRSSLSCCPQHIDTISFGLRQEIMIIDPLWQLIQKTWVHASLSFLGYLCCCAMYTSFLWIIEFKQED